MNNQLTFNRYAAATVYAVLATILCGQLLRRPYCPHLDDQLERAKGDSCGRTPIGTQQPAFKGDARSSERGVLKRQQP